LARINIGKKFFSKKRGSETGGKNNLANRVLDPWLTFTQVGKNTARLADKQTTKLVVAVIWTALQPTLHLLFLLNLFNPEK